MLHRSLHVAWLFLAPNYFHVPKDIDVMEGFFYCMERMYHYPKIQYHIGKGLAMLSLRQGRCRICGIQRSPLINGVFSMDMRHAFANIFN